MAQQYLLHLPDGTQYGPVDRETLESWSVEGRLPEETLVWPEGAPEWIGLVQALAAQQASPAAAQTPYQAPAATAAAPASAASASVAASVAASAAPAGASPASAAPASTAAAVKPVTQVARPIAQT